MDVFHNEIQPRIRSLEENVTEEQQCGLPSLPACDPRFPQPPIYLLRQNPLAILSRILEGAVRNFHHSIGGASVAERGESNIRA